MEDDRTYKPTTLTLDDETRRKLEDLKTHYAMPQTAVMRMLIVNDWATKFPQALREQLEAAQ